MIGLKLYVWEDNVLCDWKCGMICVLAHDYEEAIDKIRDKYPEYYLMDVAIEKPKVITEPEAFAIYGSM